MGGPTHDCPGGCGRNYLAREQFACGACWWWLPNKVRHGIISGDPAAVDRARALYAERAAEDAARPVGEIRYDVSTGSFRQWGGRAWRNVTRRELDEAAWETARTGRPNPFTAAIDAVRRDRGNT